MEGIYDNLQQLPAGWQRVKIGDEIEVIRGASPRPKGDPRYFGGSIPWIMISDVTKENGKFISETRDHVTEEGAEKSRYLKAGTLILSNSATVCVPKILGVAGCIHDGFIAFPNLPKRFDILYLYYFFEFIRPRVIDAHRQGITQVNLNTTIVKNIQVPVAPPNEQKRMVAEIEKQFSRLDEAVANLKRVKANLKRYKAAVLKAAVEGKLTEEWRKADPDVEPATELLKRILAERRAKWDGKGKYKEPDPPTSNDLPSVPQGWVWASVESLSIKVVDGVHKKPDYVPSGIPFVTVRNLTAGRGISFENLNYISVNDHNQFIRRAHPERGDILVSKDGTLGVIRVIDTAKVFSIFVSVALVKPVLKRMSKYLAVALQSPQVQAQMVPKGSGLQHIHLEDLREDCLPVPPLAEQEWIVAEVERRFSVIEELEAQIAADLQRAERFRQSILRRAFAGKLLSSFLNESPSQLPRTEYTPEGA